MVWIMPEYLTQNLYRFHHHNRMATKIIKHSQFPLLLAISLILFNQFLSYKIQINNLDSIKNFSDTKW